MRSLMCQVCLHGPGLPWSLCTSWDYRSWIICLLWWVGDGVSMMFFRSNYGPSKDIFVFYSFLCLPKYLAQWPWPRSPCWLKSGRHIYQRSHCSGKCIILQTFDKPSLISTSKIILHSYAANQTSDIESHLYTATRKPKQIPKNECWKCFDSLLYLSNCSCTRGLAVQTRSRISYVNYLLLSAW